MKRDSEEAKAYFASIAADKTGDNSSFLPSAGVSFTPSPTLNDMGPPPCVRMDGMPDINDPEAGFCPTKDMPYRRARRHTII